MQETELSSIKQDPIEFGSAINRGRDRDRDGNSEFGDSVQLPDSIFDF